MARSTRLEVLLLATFSSGALLAAGALAYRSYKKRRATKRQRLIEQVHAEAVAKGETGYFDPETGLFVFTELQHRTRGYCCGSGCRHCPYDHVNVPEKKAAAEAAAAAALTASKDASGGRSLKKSPIFTRTGDRGITSICGGERRSKDHPVIMFMGEVDELNSQVGLAQSVLVQHREAVAGQAGGPEDRDARYARLARQLQFVQHKLFDVGASAGNQYGGNDATKKSIRKGDVEALEEWIQDLTDYTPNIASFIIPSGDQVTCHLHVCRTVCRRVERAIVLLNGLELVDPNALGYLNRLSDFLFAAARLTQFLSGQPDIPVQRSKAWDVDEALPSA